MPLGRNPKNDSTGASQRSTIVSIVLAVIAIVAVAVGGVYFVKQRSASADATDASPASESAVGSAPLAPPAPPACGEGDALLAAMSTRDKLAQLLMVGVTGADDARAVVADDHVGGIMIGSWTDLSMMGDPLREIAASAGPLPLAVSTDEEGGRVSRLKSIIGVQPSARVLGQTASAQEVHDLALTRGQAMRALGITVDFAPVVDVSDQDDDTVIGDRSFSADPAKVTEYAGAYARGLLDAGVTPVLKHFPGHGHASGDSHLGGVVTPPLSELMTNDLVPYRELAQLPGTAVMVGHMQVPGLTGTDPASLSAPAYGSAAQRRLRRAAVQRRRVHRRHLQHGRDQPELHRGPSRSQGAAGRRRHRAVDHHRRGSRRARRAGSRREPGWARHEEGRRVGAANRRAQGQESALRGLKPPRVLTLG